MKIKSGGNSINIPVRELKTLGAKTLGLMFRNKDYDNLYFDFGYKSRHAIHSFFVFFDFLAIWLNEKNNVVSWEIVRPFNALVQPKKPCRKLIEVPLNKKNKRILAFFVEKRRKI